jgi:hypothetical protein
MIRIIYLCKYFQGLWYLLLPVPTFSIFPSFYTYSFISASIYYGKISIGFNGIRKKVSMSRSKT